MSAELQKAFHVRSAVACPTCGAPKGQACRAKATRRDRPRRVMIDPHTARVEAATEVET